MVISAFAIWRRHFCIPNDLEQSRTASASRMRTDASSRRFLLRRTIEPFDFSYWWYEEEATASPKGYFVRGGVYDPNTKTTNKEDDATGTDDWRIPEPGHLVNYETAQFL